MEEYSLEELRNLVAKASFLEGVLHGTLIRYTIIARLLVQGVDPKLLQVSWTPKEPYG